MNVIIIAALALLVLFVLAVAFSGKVRQFIKGADDCEAKQGKCIPETQQCDGAIISAQDCKDNEICCVVYTGD
jgi:hypothetical protein